MTVVRRIQPLDATDDRAVRHFHAVGWRAEKLDGRDWNDCWTYDELSRLLREPTDEETADGWTLSEDGVVVAVGMVFLSLLDNLDKGRVSVLVDPDHRGRGLGGELLEHEVAEVFAAGRTEVLTGAAIPLAASSGSPVVAFAERHGFAPVNREVVRVLPLPVRPGLLADLAQATRRHHDGYTLETYADHVPNALLASYCHLRNQLVADAPTGTVDFEPERLTPDVVTQKLDRAVRMGRRSYITLAVRDGEAVAHSDLFVLGEEPLGHQMGTLVRRDHRGRRLGTAVKVANLAAVVDAHPALTAVNTQNDETNHWMVDINVALGFEPVGVSVGFVRRAADRPASTVRA